jgi:hypothetical protein
MKNDNNTINAAILVVLTAFACWLLFRYTLRVETVHRTNSGYIVEVSALGQIDIHECN